VNKKDKLNMLYSDFSLLKNEGKYSSMIQILWTILKLEVFDFCFQNNLEYHSTEQAINEFINKSNDLKLSKAIIELYELSVMVEYDNTFILSEENYKSIYNKILHSLKYFGYE